MKKRIATALLFVVLSTGYLYGDDGWDPGHKAPNLTTRIVQLWQEIVNLF
jgi:hypothetical protein